MEERSEVEKQAQEVYRTQFRDQEKRVRRGDSIPPSSLPEMLPTRSDDQVQERCRTVTPREETPPYRQVLTSALSDEEDEDREEKRSWKRSRTEVERERGQTVRQEPTMMEIPSDHEDEPDPPRRTAGGNQTNCPVIGCTWRGRRLRNHVNRLHLPRVMWDNHSPPVNPKRYDQLNQIRVQVLRFLAKQIVGVEDLYALKRWCRQQVYIPERSGILARHIEQMRNLSETLGWQRPSFNRYELNPINHISVMIHWRYQVGMLEHLTADARIEYFNLGLDFMMSPDNFVPPATKKSSGETMMSRSILAPIAARTPQPEWDEGCQLAQEDRRIVVVDQCGTPDDIGQEVMPEDQSEARSETVQIGPRWYTLVLRGSTLDIGGAVRLSTTPDINPALDPRWDAFDIYDSHFHLDRSSKRLLGNLALDVEDWMSEPMERPPTTTVNVIGGTLIFCDPEKYPKTVPIQDKWKVAVGVHPKKVKKTTKEQIDKFVELMGSERVAAVGEIGIDRTEGMYVDEQREFLVNMAPYITAVNKPVIFHVRSTPADTSSQLCYMVLLKLCVENFPDTTKLILHCFTGTPVIVKAWLQHFEHTFFGITYLVAKFSDSQQQALREIPSNRLLLETDSPYITPPGISINSPIYLGETAAKVAKIRHVSLEHICRTTTVNAAELFGL